MTTRDRIVALLRTEPGGLDDDTIAQLLGLPQRQQANARCRELEVEGLVKREAIDGKIRNFWLVGDALLQATTEPTKSPPKTVKPWYWEGNVVRAVANRLVEGGWVIEKTADTVSGEPGADIRASRNGQALVVEVKGYPSKVYERGPRVAAV